MFIATMCQSGMIYVFIIDYFFRKLNFDENTLQASLDKLVAVGIVIEKESKHKSLGFTYEIHNMYHTCLCILFATLEIQRYSLNGISCCMGYGDYPIKF